MNSIIDVKNIIATDCTPNCPIPIVAPITRAMLINIASASKGKHIPVASQLKSLLSPVCNPFSML